MAKGRGRGMLRLEYWSPCRRPGQARDPTIKPVAVSDLVRPQGKSTDAKKQHANGPPVPPIKEGSKPVQLLAKYNYKANPNRPGGFDEMSLTAGEKLEFIATHSVNPYWWEAKREESGEVAFVPASYIMVLESKLETLPWLEDMKAAKEKRKEEMEETNSGIFGNAPPPLFKPYVSAYSRTHDSTAPESARKFYCEVCDKTLNGPKPYQAHMVSRAHRDEVEAASYIS
ncbi:predicted protein [Nematostella vectensis]|uniref:SH3 domain-containing protein n=1 Tax=Nematostella vectensis TaxID=45351 RepID=A7RRM2_NEMVE|nr:uncharacterized protein LOC5517859 [Nematostella vectensis]EDO45784.1 predicted protein [Nematostella vectensis]|eukprot:XP_001637847.1 predicted protein [Nematostella vectensis]